MNKPEYVYEVRTTNDEQVWIPYYYDFDNAVNKAVELIKEMGYPEENIYSDNDSQIEHFFVEGTEDPEDPEKGDIEVAYIMSWLVEDYVGLNQGKIKEIVEDEIRNKVDRAIDQVIKSLDAESSSGNFISEKIQKIFNGANTNYMISQCIKKELQDRIIQITMKNVEVKD